MADSNSIVAIEKNIVCYRGDTFARVLTFWQNSLNTIPLDISGDRFDLHVIKNARAKNNPILIFSTEGTDPAITFTGDHTLNFNKAAEEMDVLAGVFLYDLQRTLTDTTVVTVQKGEFTITDDRTITLE